MNEAYLRLADQTKVDWQGKAHFCAMAATMMRRVLLDHARKRNAAKRQAKVEIVNSLDTILPDISPGPVDVVVVDDLLQRLSEFSSRQGRVFELRCFGGMGVRETAQVLGVSEATVKNDWRFAKAWLASRLAPEKDA